MPNKSAVSGYPGTQRFMNEREAKRRNAREPLGAHARSSQKPIQSEGFLSQILSRKPHKRLLVESVRSNNLTCAPRSKFSRIRLRLKLVCEREHVSTRVKFRPKSDAVKLPFEFDNLLSFVFQTNCTI